MRFTTESKCNMSNKETYIMDSFNAGPSQYWYKNEKPILNTSNSTDRLRPEWTEGGIEDALSFPQQLVMSDVEAVQQHQPSPAPRHATIWPCKIVVLVLAIMIAIKTQLLD